MAKVMHKYLIYLSINFRLTCFGPSFSPTSEAGVQLWQWFRSRGYGVSARVLITLSLLMSYIYMELLVKPDILTSYIYGPTFGKAESRLFLFAAKCFSTESMQKVILWHSCV
jgi:hypothetical protein